VLACAVRLLLTLLLLLPSPCCCCRVQLMSASQVSGGFWCQLPIDLAPHYGTDKQQHKRTLTLHCFDKAQQQPDDFM
jgi:hypothetical protein